MGFFEDLGDFLFGSDEGTKQQENLRNQITTNLLNKDNRMNDFNTFSGQALNSLANRGIINSSVTSSAMANALNQADQNYINTQLQGYNLLQGLMPQDTTGLIPQVASAFAGGVGSALPKLLTGGI